MDLNGAEYLLNMRPVPLEFSDTFANVADQCSDLTVYGVRSRYPMELMLEERDVLQALSNAKAIRDFVLALVPEMAPKELEQEESQSASL